MVSGFCVKDWKERGGEHAPYLSISLMHCTLSNWPWGREKAWRDSSSLTPRGKQRWTWWNAATRYSGWSEWTVREENQLANQIFDYTDNPVHLHKPNQQSDRSTIRSQQTAAQQKTPQRSTEWSKASDQPVRTKCRRLKASDDCSSSFLSFNKEKNYVYACILHQVIYLHCYCTHTIYNCTEKVWKIVDLKKMCMIDIFQKRFSIKIEMLLLVQPSFLLVFLVYERKLEKKKRKKLLLCKFT